MDNRAFWDERYTREPWLGSGPGSRGVAAHYKADLLHRIVTWNPIRSVVDVGCGDMCWLTTADRYPDWMAGVDYTGIDISRVVVERNAEAFPRCRFLHHDITSGPIAEDADLLVCFDVLLHQVERATFDAALSGLLGSMRRHAVVSYLDAALDAPVVPVLDGFDGEIERRFQGELKAARGQRDIPVGSTSCFGLLPDLVAEVRDDLAVRLIGQYRFQKVYEITCGDWLRV